MATTAKSLIDSVLGTLVDDTGMQWSRAELLRYLNEAQQAVVIARPDACAVIATMQLAPNVTKQTLPAAAIRLIGFVRNMGDDGTKPGAPVRLADQDSMDAHLPGWHTSAPKGVIQHYVYDALTPRDFYVWPRPYTQKPVYVELKYSGVPAPVASEGVDPTYTNITLDDLYAIPIKQYMLHLAYAKDLENAGNLASAQAWLAAFENSMGVKMSTDMGVSPNRTKSSAGKP